MIVSQWQRERNKKKTKLRWPSTRRGWLNRWKKSLEVLEEQVHRLRDAKDMYNAYTKIVFDNPQLDKSNEFLVLIEDMYLNYMLIGIRRLDDRDFRSHSLYNLIEEIFDRREHVSKAWYIRQYKRQLKSTAKKAYERTWGTGLYPAKSRLRADLCRLKRDCGTARRIVNKYLAHTGRRRHKMTLSFEETNALVKNIHEMWHKYWSLVAVTCWACSEAHGWERIFDKPFRHQSAFSK
jgi:hypothetical protein